MEQDSRFVDMLEERRKDHDISWIMRPVNLLLPHKLPAESNYSRDEVINLVLSDIRVRRAIDTIAIAKNINRKNMEKSARAMIKEIASKEDLATVRCLGIILTKVIKRMFSKIYINENELNNLKEKMQISQIQYVYVPSHRSYLDFILLSYILFSYDMALPNIASGLDFYNMNIIGEMLRKTGAFYMRRSFSNDLLYKEVFRSYIKAIVSHSGRAIEFFIEGTRSRSQKSIMPKYGLLSMILESLFQGDVPDIYFVPISISYERPPEELLFIYEILGVPKPKESTTGLFRSLSILQKPFSHGCVFFNIGEPISARQFIDTSHFKAKVLSPYTKLPSTVVDNIAYQIIESHKKNTVLMPINIVALLLNERVLTQPKELYTLNLLIQDYQWIKNFITKVLNILLHPKTGTDSDNIKQEILLCLKLHDELITFDEFNRLKLKQRHRGTKINVKGHSLSELVMQVAVPAINIALYVNPILTFLVKTALITVTIREDGTKAEKALKQYELLRRLLNMEFVIRPIVNKDLIRMEWEESLNILLSQKCLYILENSIFPGDNKKLRSILYNVILPFIDVIYVICTLLSEWKEEISGELTNRVILIETQKEVERLILQNKGQHPYCLSLDLYSTTLSNLLSQGIIIKSQGSVKYQIDKVALTNLLDELRDLSLQHPGGTYIDALPLIISPSPLNILAKL